jgi:hypothetical protein
MRTSSAEVRCLRLSRPHRNDLPPRPTSSAFEADALEARREAVRVHRVERVALGDVDGPVHLGPRSVAVAVVKFDHTQTIQAPGEDTGRRAEAGASGRESL